MSKPLFVYIVSLGCSKNFVDTEVMAANLIMSNIGLTDNPDEASVYLINTCAFIPPARDEAEENINEALKWKKLKPKTRKVIISGCLSQWDKKKIYLKKYPEIDLWIGTNELTIIAQKIKDLFTNNLTNNFICKENPHFLYTDRTPRLQLTPPHYSIIKIAEGCNNRCSYCAIPNIRGNLRSRNINSIIKEANSLLANGSKEIILIAQDITAFSDDQPTTRENLSLLLKELDKIEGDHWFRLHYLHPEGISDELIDTIASSTHIIPYLDIPIQHASDKILQLMNRRISSKELDSILEKLKKNIENLIIRTTFLVGFPGETNEDFNTLLDFVNKWKFERLGVFKFYPEPGTSAFTMNNKVDDETALKRAEIIQKLHNKHSKSFNKSKIDSNFTVLIDEIKQGIAIGRTYMDSPDVDNVIKIKRSKSLKQGNFYKVRVIDYEDYALIGKLATF